MSTRREFIKMSAIAGGALRLGFFPDFSIGSLSDRATAKASDREIAKADKSLRILILGGTGFIGPHQVRYALERGHRVTLFNRGKTNPKLFPNVEQLEGDRNDKLDALKGREWDVVIDNPTTLPRWVRTAAEILKDAVKQYVFISTISVYADFSKPNMDESASVAKIDDPTVEKVTYETYGPLKALAEKEAEKAFPGKATIIRPGLIVGPGDYSDRFTYWPVRINRGGEVLAPGDPNDPVQFIDARDLSEWTIRMVEQGDVGTYNATGPKGSLSIAEMLYGIRAVTTADVKFTWGDADFLESQKVSGWTDLPVWVPARGDTFGLPRINIARALNKGLTYRPLAVTAKDTLDWHSGLPADQQAKLKLGLSSQREEEVLAAWHARKK